MAVIKLREVDRMFYSKLCELINDFPKLNDVYQRKVDEGFSITNILASSILQIN
jgi:hypothetical protein